MVSVITCVSNQDQYERFCLPTLKETSERMLTFGLPELDIIQTSHPTSIFLAYNDAMQKAKFPVKVFMHQDVDLLDTNWLNKVLTAFSSDKTVALVGLVGTKKLGDRGFWWESGREHIVGELYSGQEKADWKYNTAKEMNYVECVDGFFMATNQPFPFDANMTGFHFYDMDYSRTVRKLGYKIVNVNHKAWHIGAIRDQDLNHLWKVYKKKWSLPE